MPKFTPCLTNINDQEQDSPILLRKRRETQPAGIKEDGVMKSILLHAARDNAMESRLQAALDIARRCDGHLTLLHGQAYHDYLAIDMFGGAHLMADVLAASEELQTEIRQKMSERLANEAVKWDWRDTSGATIDMLVEASRFSDLIILSRGDGEAINRNVQRSIIGDIVMDSGRPVLVVPENSKGLSFDRAMVAYDGSPEAASAIRSALPLLKLAEAVEIVEVEEKESEYPLTDAAEYLARHGISCQIRELKRARQGIAETLLGHAGAFEPDYLVMGAYGHSRLRQTLFGGVTRHMLSEADFPLLLAS